MNRLSLFVHELRRRHVTRSGLAYIVTAWLGVEVVETLSGAFDLPDLLLQIVLIAAVICFIPVLVFSWFYEITRDGIVKTEDLPPDTEIVPPLGRRLDFVIVAILAAALTLSVYGNLRAPEEMPEPISILIADFDDQTATELPAIARQRYQLPDELPPFIDKVGD